jgi:hypothetical protein
MVLNSDWMSFLDYLYFFFKTQIIHLPKNSLFSLGWQFWDIFKNSNVVKNVLSKISKSWKIYIIKTLLFESGSHGFNIFKDIQNNSKFQLMKKGRYTEISR